MSRGVVKRGGSVASLRRRRTMIIAASAALAFQACSSASTFTWTGSGTALASAAWDYSSAGAFTNWNPALVLPSSSDDVVFGSGFASGNPNLNGSRTVRSLTIDTASGVSLAGASSSDGLTLTSGGLTRTAASSGTQTINVSVTPGASALWNIGGSGAL